MSHLISFEVEGNAMEPTIKPGDVVHVDSNTMPAANGKEIGVFIINDNLHLAKHTVYGNQLILIHDNDRHAVVPFSNVEFLGKVVEIKNDHSAGNTLAI